MCYFTLPLIYYCFDMIKVKVRQSWKPDMYYTGCKQDKKKVTFKAGYKDCG